MSPHCILWYGMVLYFIWSYCTVSHCYVPLLQRAGELPRSASSHFYISSVPLSTPFWYELETLAEVFIFTFDKYVIYICLGGEDDDQESCSRKRALRVANICGDKNILRNTSDNERIFHICVVLLKKEIALGVKENILLRYYGYAFKLSWITVLGYGDVQIETSRRWILTRGSRKRSPSETFCF